MKIVLAGHGSGVPSTKGMNAYCSSRYARGKGLVEVRRLLLSEKQRHQMHDEYRTLIGRNIYSLDLRDYCYKSYRGGYYSDCSSSICRTAERIGFPELARLNTAGMHYRWNSVDPVRIEAGLIVNPEVLRIGDALMFKGSNPERPLGIGHAEMVYEIDGPTASLATPQTPSGNTVVRAGQMHANNFCGAGLATDGVCGPLTRQAGIKVLQTAMNLDYHASLEIDGIYGTKTDTALDSHTVRKGETQYMVTALEILLMINGYNPNGVECPGVFGNGARSAVIRFQTDRALQIDGIAGRQTYRNLIGL